MGTTGQSITLANSIIGVGILAMPFCFQQCGVVLATLILVFMGLVSRLCCYFLLKSALITRRRNFEFLAFHVFGSAGKLAVEVGIIGFLMGTCIAYFVVVGDLGPQIVSKMFNINQSDILRTCIMVIVSLVCVLPLGLLRNVDSLSNVSAATICFYFCLVMKVIAEAASQMFTTSWETRVEMWRPAGVLQCVPIFSMALFCQTQLFEIFESLPSLSLEKMNVVTKNAINICTCVYFTLGLFGYIAFSAQDISGNILMSLSPTMASDVIKLGFVMSVAFSFPLIIFPCRASLYSLLYKKVHSSHHDHIINHSIPVRSFRCITVGIVGASLCVGLALPNIELVLGLVGATIGVLVCVVFPAAAFVRATHKDTNERLLAKGIIILGLIIMVLGTCANLQAAESQIDKYDDKYITKERIDKMVEDFFQKQEKPDGVIIKPEFKNGPDETNKINDDILKESVVLPPNPVPPESQSNEKKEETKPKPIVKDVAPEILQETVDKVSETHPKNLNKGHDAKHVNGVKDNQEQKQVEKPKENNQKPQSLEDKMNKQQQLIETIKQHGEEQKELLKEQKEILSELQKTKQELEKNKNDAADADAKKIAVESIKKIANMAIQSLAGVSDKPGEIGDEKKSEQLEKLADEAVQEIAQKAVETIEAIKEIKEKPDAPKPLPNVPLVPVPPNNNLPLNNGQNVNPNQVQQNVVSNGQVNPQNVPQPNAQLPNIGQPIANVAKDVNVPQPPANVVQPVKTAQLPANNVQPSANIGQPIAQALSNNAPVANLPPIPANVGQPPANNKLPDANVQANIAQAVVNNQPAANQIAQNIPNNNNLPVKNNQNELPVQNKQKSAETAKQHLHALDEPQSYKQGEDVQKKNNDQALNNIVAKNVPLPLAINGNTQQKINENVNAVQNSDNANVKIDGIQNANQKTGDKSAVRQKREVVDCTEKSALKPEDKEICKTLIDNKPDLNKDVKDILSSQVDLTDIGLPKNLPFHPNIIHHISRSLKLYKEPSKNER
ncbi:putative sodium-coupled neutral amino acid transporter 10 [Ostrinia nubilalis]|uniref:putative sodium-coupled neutral amino acid transporter 10 n=1 Tax=Ostrinia nubilalis TaxID=29057 RepID=UPI00308238F5